MRHVLKKIGSEITKGVKNDKQIKSIKLPISRSTTPKTTIRVIFDVGRMKRDSQSRTTTF